MSEVTRVKPRRGAHGGISLQTTELIDQIYFSSGDSQASGLAELVAFFRYSTRAHAPVAEVEFVALEEDGERTPADSA
jgi:hypothetical protein